MDTIPAWAFGLITTGFFSLTSIVWMQLNYRIKKVEENKVDATNCSLKEKLTLEKFNGIERRIEDMSAVSVRDHEKLEESILLLTASMGEVKDCLVKLANRKEC